MRRYQYGYRRRSKAPLVIVMIIALVVLAYAYDVGGVREPLKKLISFPTTPCKKALQADIIILNNESSLTSTKIIEDKNFKSVDEATAYIQNLNPNRLAKVLRELSQIYPNNNSTIPIIIFRTDATIEGVPISDLKVATCKPGDTKAYEILDGV